MKKILISSLFFLISFLHLTGNTLTRFNTIEQLETYKKQHNELPDIDNKSWIKPDYTSFYKSLEPSFLSNVATFLHLKKKSEWSSSLLKHLLEKVTQQRIKNGYTKKHIIKLKPLPKTKFVIWGDLQGALHSLVRDLKELQKLNIINNELKITNPNNYFVFNGDAINRSPYSLETLTIILRLLEKNPNQVIYIRGNHEHEDHFDYGIKKELQIKARNISDEKVPLKNLVASFFKTLPLALYLKIEGGKESEFVKITARDNSISNPSLNEAFFSDFLLEKETTPFQFFLLKKNSIRKNKISIKAIIKSESRSTIFRPTDGLSLIPQEQGAISWTTLSSPIQSYQKFYNFNNDAFTILEVKKHPQDWPLTLYYKDIRKKDGFEEARFNEASFQSRVVNFFTGMKVKDKKDFIQQISPITLGCTLDLSGIDAELGKRLKNGIELRINEENEKGGINKHFLKVIFLNDHFIPHRAKTNVETLIKKHNVDILISPSGSPTTEAYLSLVKQKKVLVLFPFTGSTIFKDRSLEYMFHYRPFYATEAESLVHYAIKKLTQKRFAIFYQDDSYGQYPLYAARKILQQYNTKEWIEISYSRNKINIEQAAEKIRDFNPEVILFFSSYSPSKKLVKKLGIEYLINTTLMTISGMSNVFRDFLRKHGLPLIITRIAPNVHKSDLKIVAQYRKAQLKNKTPHLISQKSLESYITTSLLIEALKKIGEPITKEKIADYFSSLRNYNFNGLILNFDPETRQLKKNFWIDIGNNNWIPCPGH